MPIPPPLGVGEQCEDRWLGISITPLRWSSGIRTPVVTPVAANAAAQTTTAHPTSVFGSTESFQNRDKSVIQPNNSNGRFVPIAGCSRKCEASEAQAEVSNVRRGEVTPHPQWSARKERSNGRDSNPGKRRHRPRIGLAEYLSKQLARDAELASNLVTSGFEHSLNRISPTVRKNFCDVHDFIWTARVPQSTRTNLNNIYSRVRADRVSSGTRIAPHEPEELDPLADEPCSKARSNEADIQCSWEIHGYRFPLELRATSPSKLS